MKNITLYVMKILISVIIHLLAALTILFDLVVLITPCPMVWRLQMSKWQRIVILGMLLVGAVYESVFSVLIILTHLAE